MRFQAWPAIVLFALTACASQDASQGNGGDDSSTDATLQDAPMAEGSPAEFGDSAPADGGIDTSESDGAVADAPGDGSIDGLADSSSDASPDVLVPADGGACPDGGGCPGCLTCCSGQCVDLSNDPSHCQSCGVACEAGQMCWQSGCIDDPPCVPPCEFDQTCCLDLHHEAGLFTVDCVNGKACPLCTQLP
jgi:hypothetical protein